MSAPSFERGREQMKALLAGLEVTTKAVERTTESIHGVDIARREQDTPSSKPCNGELPIAVGQVIPTMYVQMDGTGGAHGEQRAAGAGRVKEATDGQHTREVKSSVVSSRQTHGGCRRLARARRRQHQLYGSDRNGRRDFPARLYTEAQRRGWDRAQKKVVVGDGAEWIWNLAQEQFPGAIEIVDLYHARQHLWDLSGKLHPSDVAAKRRWVMSHQHFLDDGKIEPLVNRLRAQGTEQQELAEEIETEANYFERNAARMRYPKFRKQGLFVGSGVIEAGCKTLIATRLKRSGMFWTVRGANAVIAVRCCRQSREFDDYWESRQA